MQSNEVISQAPDPLTPQKPSPASAYQAGEGFAV